MDLQISCVPAVNKIFLIIIIKFKQKMNHGRNLLSTSTFLHHEIQCSRRPGRSLCISCRYSAGVLFGLEDLRVSICQAVRNKKKRMIQKRDIQLIVWHDIY